MTCSLDYLNTCAAAEFVRALSGIYEHSPWVPERAASARPFATLAALRLTLQQQVDSASAEEQLALIRAHPELAGKAAIAGRMTQESLGEQAKAGLNNCSPEEFATLQQLNADYNGKFGFPFILAVKGPDGKGLTRRQIIDAFGRRLKNTGEDERCEALRQIHRIGELRLNDLTGATPDLGDSVMEQAAALAAWSDEPDGLTCTYLTPSHRRVATQIAEWMREAGMEVGIDAVGNVTGRYVSDNPHARTLMTGSHYDTVRNSGRYDGRAGILIPIAAVKRLHDMGEKLPFHLELIAFSEEEGVRFQTAFIGSNAVAGRFDMALLDRQDSSGIALRSALLEAGHDPADIPAAARRPADLLGFVELHIEQGPVLLQRGLPLGIVTSIAGSCRYQVEIMGVASHAGTTPMAMRRDAAAAAAEIVLHVEQRCAQQTSLVGTVGQLQVPNGSVNVIPGSCRFSLDIRAADDATRDAAVADVRKKIDEVCARRQLAVNIENLLHAPAVPCAPRLMRQLEAAFARAGIPSSALVSGAGHDAMAIAALTDVAMLFIRCGNGGISHNPLETITADDAELAAQVFLDFLRNFAVR